MTSQTFELDLIPQGVPPVVHVSQYDRGQVWFIEVLENGVPYEIPTGCAVTIQGSKPDNTAFQYACTYSGNIVAAVLMQQMCAVVGDVSCEVRITANDAAQIIGSLNFVIEVEEGSIADDTIVSETDISLIEQAIELAERVPEIIQECEQYVIASGNNAVQSEKWATGTANGTPVTSGDTTYHNNSKYYSEQAATSASNAATSATNAGNSEDNAEAWAKGTKDGVAVPSTADQYHNNSKYYSEQAATSALNAATSETNAATSKNNAATSATNAATSATNAGNSATLAQSYAKGGTGTRTGEDTDNAYYYMEEAKAAASGAGVEDFTGATASANGIHGLVPQPLIADRTKYLKGDGNWGTPSGAEVNYSNSTSGLSATTVQAALDEIDGNVDTLAAKVTMTNVYKVTTPSFSSLPQTFTVNGITANHELVQDGFALLSTPSAQGNDWTITTGTNTVTISGTFSGSTATTVTMSLGIPTTKNAS
jgi:hypothetical protein